MSYTLCLSGPFFIVWAVYLDFYDWCGDQWDNFWWYSPVVKTCRWVYISWLLAYSSGDDATELEIPALQEDERDNFFAEEEEITGNYGEDIDDLGGYPLKDPPRFPWEIWWQKETDSFYDEGLEIAHELFFGRSSKLYSTFYSPFY